MPQNVRRTVLSTILLVGVLLLVGCNTLERMFESGELSWLQKAERANWIDLPDGRELIIFNAEEEPPEGVTPMECDKYAPEFRIVGEGTLSGEPAFGYVVGEGSTVVRFQVYEGTYIGVQGPNGQPLEYFMPPVPHDGAFSPCRAPE